MLPDSRLGSRVPHESTLMRARIRPPAAVAAIAVALMLTGCAPPEPPHPIPHMSSVPAPVTPTPSPSVPAPSVVGDAAVASTKRVAVYTAPHGGLLATFVNPQRSGAPLTFLVVDDDGDGWLKVELPQRPNGSTGWVSADSVTLQRLAYSLRASTRDNTLSLYKDSVLVATYSVATGTGGTPTPARLVLSDGIAAADQWRLWALRVRPFRLFRSPQQLRRRSGTDRPARHRGRCQHRAGSKPRMHPHVQCRHHRAGRAVAVGNADRHRVSRRSREPDERVESAGCDILGRVDAYAEN